MLTLTLNLPGIAGLSIAVDYINSIGIDKIYKKEMTLLKQLTEGLAGLPEVNIIGPKSLADKCAVAALDFYKMDNAAVAARLDQEYGIMTRCGLHCAPNAHKALGTYPRGAIRCSFGHKNTEDEVDRLLEAIYEIVKGGN